MEYDLNLLVKLLKDFGAFLSLVRGGREELKFHNIDQVGSSAGIGPSSEFHFKGNCFNLHFMTHTV